MKYISDGARAVVYDYVSAYVNLKTAYKSQDKNTEAVEYAKHSQFLNAKDETSFC